MNDDVVLQIYQSKAPNQSGYLLLTLAVAVLSVMCWLFYLERDILFNIKAASDVIVLLLVVAIICTWILYLLDEAIWQIFGKEECVCNKTGLVITKRRLIRRNRKIPWNDLLEISPCVPSHFWQLITHFTITGVPQDTIMVRYGNGRKITCGAGLNRTQAQEAIITMRNYKEQYILN